jgi:GWxTD domain-containing protein
MMMHAVLQIAVVALAGTIPVQGTPLNVTMYRSFVEPNVTVVNGLFRVDGEMLGTGASCEYTVSLFVEDSTGTRLVANEWEGHCPPPVNGVAAGALETFEFAVVPSTYTVTVVVEPKARPEGRVTTKTVLHSLPAGAVLSDLILARKAGWIEPGRESEYSLKKGELGIAAASEAVSEEMNPSLAYYMEMYPAGATLSGRLTGVIRRPDGLQIAELALQTLDGVDQARPLAGNLSLAGLAPGDYVLEARLDLGDTVLVRTHPFRMEGRQFAQAAQPTADTGWFGTLSEERLAELFDPVMVTLTAQADRDLYRRLNPDGRRRFLVQYFGVNAPSAEGSDPNPLDLYLERVDHVTRQFATRFGDDPAWQTDRGRIYLRRGEPQAKVARPLPPVGAAPYEIWQYTSAPNYAYVFVDESRVGAYRLVWSSDPNESSLPDWDRRVSAEAIEEMTRLGIRPGGGGN